MVGEDGQRGVAGQAKEAFETVLFLELKRSFCRSAGGHTSTQNRKTSICFFFPMEFDFLLERDLVEEGRGGGAF